MSRFFEMLRWHILIIAQRLGLVKHVIVARQRFTEDSDTRCQGAVYVEVALSLPVLILFFFAGTDISTKLRIHQKTLQIARETAYASFKKCSCYEKTEAMWRNCPAQPGLEDQCSPAQAARNACLSESGLAACLNDLDTSIDHSIQVSQINNTAFGVRISVLSCASFSCQGECKPNPTLGEACTCSCIGTISHNSHEVLLNTTAALNPVPQSRLDFSNLSAELVSMLNQRGEVVFAEVFAQGPPVENIISNGAIYEATLY